MPHDILGNELREGDVVMMRMRVSAVYPTEKACNVTLVAVDGPESEYKPVVSCNTKLVRLDKAVEESTSLDSQQS